MRYPLESSPEREFEVVHIVEENDEVAIYIEEVTCIGNGS